MRIRRCFSKLELAPNELRKENMNGFNMNFYRLLIIGVLRIEIYNLMGMRNVLWWLFTENS